MASSGTQEASSSVSRWTYQVFLSFRGKGTCKNFADHLYSALVQAGIHTFRDDEEIEKGEDIKSELRRAIEQSRISLIIMSKDYASSSWCLDELVKILDCKKTSRHIIFPVYYDVEPSQVKNQMGSFAEAFAYNKENLKLETDGRKKKWMERVERWKAALREVSDLGGMVLQNQADRDESKFIQKIVKEIKNKLNHSVLFVAPHPVGIDSRVQRINLWLQDGSPDVGIFVIYGMGGIGKTTIAKAVYNLNYGKFECSSFLANIREASEQPNGLIRLQKQLLSDMLKGRKEKIFSVDEGISKLRNAVRCKKVLLILDDVDELHQLHAILGMRDWFYSGSKIIITTRNGRLLKTREVFEMYEAQELDNNESLQLFSWHAFQQDHPVKGYMTHSKRVIKRCGGLPLALQVLGSSLYGKSVKVWKSALRKLKAIPNNQILKTLMISYDSLEDDHDRNLFLDIVSFFIGKDKDYTVTVLDACDFYTTVGIQNLINKCLITIDEHNKLMMHQLVRDMGREVIHLESTEEPGKRSRLWRHKDSFDVLKEKTGTEMIEGLVLDMQMLKQQKSSRSAFGINNRKRHHFEEYSDNSMLSLQDNPLKWRRLGSSRVPVNTSSSEIYLETEAFTMMRKLRLLQLSDVQLIGGYKEFPKKLRWLRWHGFPLKFIPCDFPLYRLVVLEMCRSGLEHVWKGTKVLQFLKILNLSHCHGLVKTPDFSRVPSLEKLILKDCVRLAVVHESIGDLKRLVILNLRGCKNLSKLPREICKLKSLKELVLSDCSRLEELPQELWRMEFLKVLKADDTAINQLSSTSVGANSWISFFWSWLSKPRPSELSLASLPRFLVKLSLMDCNISDDSLPKDLHGLHSLQKLYLGGNPLCSLPESIKGLTTLESLQLDLCRSLQSLPELPPSLRWLNAEDCRSLQRITNLPNWLKSLRLELYDCTELVEIQGLFRLEPIAKIDHKMVNYMHLVDLEHIEKFEVDLRNNLIENGKRGPIQGLFEFGIFSIFIPGDEVPYWFSNKTSGSSIFLTVASLRNLNIEGLNVCVVYALPSSDGGWVFDENYLTVSNETKGLKWTYAPVSFGNPENKYMLWLSHWKFSNEYLECEDQVNVSVVMNNYFQIKECGVHLLYDKEEKHTKLIGDEAMIQYSNYPCYQNVTNADWSAYETSRGSSLLCNYACNWRRSSDGYDPQEELETTEEEDDDDDENNDDDDDE